MGPAFTSEEGLAVPSLGVMKNPADASEQSVGCAANLFLMNANILILISAIEQAGVPALRVAFTSAVLIFLLVGAAIFRRRHQLFDRDPDVDNDVPVVRRNREELITLVWSGMTLVLIAIMCAVWSA
jgi:hypothetical protein